MSNVATTALGNIKPNSPFLDGWSIFTEDLAALDDFPLPLINDECLIRPDALLTLTPTLHGGLRLRMGNTLNSGSRLEYPFGKGFDWNRVRHQHSCLSVTNDARVGAVCLTVQLDDGSLRNWVRGYDITDMNESVAECAEAARQAYETKLKLSTISERRIILDVALNYDATRALIRVIDPVTDAPTTFLLS